MKNRKSLIVIIIIIFLKKDIKIKEAFKRVLEFRSPQLTIKYLALACGVVW